MSSSPQRLASTPDSPVGTVKPQGKWHHGDLRASLIQWGTYLLDRDGAAGMSLRATAKLAGVSQGAPAYHFVDKNGLLAAIAAQGFRDLVALRKARLEQLAPSDAQGRLRALLATYIEFARSYPARFELMYGPLLGRRTEYPELVEAGTASFALLREVVLPLLPAERSTDLTDDDVSQIVWAAVHGLATLEIHRLRAPIRTAPRKSIDAAADALVAFCMCAIQGLQAKRSV